MFYQFFLKLHKYCSTYNKINNNIEIETYQKRTNQVVET